MNKYMDRSKAKERYAAGKMRQHSTRALFFIGGFGAASWAPLIPLLRERLAIGEDVLGMMLLCIGIGSLLTMPLSGAAAVRFGCRRTLTVAAERCAYQHGGASGTHPWVSGNTYGTRGHRLSGSPDQSLCSLWLAGVFGGTAGPYCDLCIQEGFVREAGSSYLRHGL